MASYSWSNVIQVPNSQEILDPLIYTPFGAEVFTVAAKLRVLLKVHNLVLEKRI